MVLSSWLLAWSGGLQARWYLEDGGAPRRSLLRAVAPLRAMLLVAAGGRSVRNEAASRRKSILYSAFLHDANWMPTTLLTIALLKTSAYAILVLGTRCGTIRNSRGSTITSRGNDNWQYM